MAYTTINKSTEHFNTKLYSGTGTAQSITGVGFQPDWTWIKVRNVADNHFIYDSVRGATKFVHSDLANAESTLTNGLTSFDSDGFSLGDSGSTNNASNTFVSWNWLAGGASSANTDGSINSTVSVNTTAGFSIVKYTGNGTSGATIGHGLGSVPKVMFIRDYDAAAGFQVYHVATGNTQFAGYLNATDAAGTTAGAWNNTTPTSSVFTVGNGGNTNTNGDNHIAYIFSEKKGYSKFGSYTGNGNADGTFVYTGFKPAFVILKRTDATNNWHIGDNKRINPYNPLSTQFYPNLTNAESEQADLDFLSNGFKTRNTSSFMNASGGSYIYMAFGQSLVGSNNVPCTAR